MRRMENSRLSYLRAMGVDVYVSRHAPAGMTDEVAADQAGESAQGAVSVNQASGPLSEPVRQPDVISSPAAAVPEPEQGLGTKPASAPASKPGEEIEPTPSAPPPPDQPIAPAATSIRTSAEPAAPADFNEEPPLPESPYAPSIQLDDETAQTETEPEPDPVAGMNWEDLRKAVAVCERCELHSTRTQSVFGVGHPNARLMVIGEAPGRDEDLQGEPFVGMAGKLLDQMLKAAGFERKDVFIANILKCRPPNNRDPKAGEAEACRAYLERQIDLVQPEAILSVGRVSAQNLLESEQSIGRLRGGVHRLPGREVPVFVTYHPAYLLRQPAEKRKAWVDLQMLMSALEL